MRFHSVVFLIAILFAVMLVSCSTIKTEEQTPQVVSMPQQGERPTPTVTVIVEKSQVRAVDGMKMVFVPGGTFSMGSTEQQVVDAIELCNQHYSICNRWFYERESPRHVVTVDDFWIDQHEVSNDQYRACVEAGICVAPVDCEKGEPTFADPAKDDHPVVCVAWEDAQTYCQWVGARLPTEAEWEYAFRGTAEAVYPWGEAFDGTRLNYCDANCSQPHADQRFDDGYPLTAPVGSFPLGASWASALNMSGNVSEWVADWFGEYTSDALSNPTGPVTGSEKIIKGCSWYYHPAYCRGMLRPSVDPETRFDYLGFRCAYSENQIPEEEPSMIINPDLIPPGNLPTLDGTHTPGEWDDAAVETFADGSQLFLKQAGDYLYLGIKANTSEMVGSNVLINSGDEISIMHSSAALGTAIYQQGKESWQQVQNFDWRCRDTGNSAAAKTERAEFLQAEGWLAANARTGTPNELEYQIKIPDLPFRLAVVIIHSVPPYDKIPWPVDLDDDSIASTPEGLPIEMHFSPEKWHMIDG